MSADDGEYRPGKDDHEDDFVLPTSSASNSLRRSRNQPSTSKASSSKPRASTGPVPKLKVKISEKSALNEPLYTTRKHDREIDSDPEEELIIEEQFILRLPQGELLKKMREQVASRELGKNKEAEQPWFKFRDSRRAVFGWGKPDDPDHSQMYQARLVDLPTITESHKTPDAGKHMYKVADISQMLIVENPIEPGIDPAFFDQDFNIEDFYYPHGITPPLRHARKRRFRRRANKRAIEMVEKQVEALLTKDNQASKVTYELVDPADLEEALPAPPPERSPSRTPSPPAETPGGSGAPTPMGDRDDDDTSQDEIDDDLAAELERGMGHADSSDSGDDGEGSDSDMGGLFGSGGSGDEQPPEDDEDVDENDPEQVEYRRRARLLGDEIRDLEGVVARKTMDLDKAPNPIIKRRFEETLRKLTAELELKKSQLAIALAGPKAAEAEAEEGPANGEPVV